jgi:hypothetical protein
METLFESLYFESELTLMGSRKYFVTSNCFKIFKSYTPHLNSFSSFGDEIYRQVRSLCLAIFLHTLRKYHKMVIRFSRQESASLNFTCIKTVLYKNIIFFHDQSRTFNLFAGGEVKKLYFPAPTGSPTRSCQTSSLQIRIGYYSTSMFSPHNFAWFLVRGVTLLRMLLKVVTRIEPVWYTLKPLRELSVRLIF